MASWSVAERSKAAHARWNSLSRDEREEWKKQAKIRNEAEPEDLPYSCKKKMAEASIRRLSNEVYDLACFVVHIMTIHSFPH